MVAGLDSPDVNSCFPEPGGHSCDDFAGIDCAYEGPVVFEGNLTYPVECQNFLITLGPSIGANYFIFEVDTRRCRLLDLTGRTCNGFSGPDYPNYEEECEGDSTTPGGGSTMTTEPVKTTTTPSQGSGGKYNDMIILFCWIINALLIIRLHTRFIST